MPFARLHGHGLTNRVRDGLVIVRIDQDGALLQISRRTGEFAEDEDALIVDAAGAVFLGHQVHAIFERGHQGDLGGAIMGSLGLGPSGNINPEKSYPSMFEPIHGSAPDIAGQGIVNPIGAIWSGAIMLEHLGEKKAADNIVQGIEKTIAQGALPVDLGGSAKTTQITDSVVKNLG